MSVSLRKISRLLIANRGEIACRIIRTARSLGIETIAVYSDIDRDAQHVQQADRAIHIGPAPSNESYLVIERIINAAAKCNADAVHPGYGFLSENADFAQACAEAGLIFVGPSAEAIDIMGDKAKAKRRMIATGVPCIPGYHSEDQSNARLVDEANNIGFPVMVKAAAGGGGRGMRLVSSVDQLPSAITTARSEAFNAFGLGDLILERAIVDPRHVEIQIMADTHGNIIHLGERDCSVQRRHQKVLEEAPCPVMAPSLRNAMGEAAIKAAADINYVGAGTVEFLLNEDGLFYFLEMNTRLQVEHPVTEMITGLDLVALQLRICEGEVLPISQDDINLEGHAIEARLYAEDPASDFLPAAGILSFWKTSDREGVRTDTGVASGDTVSSFYDPMIAKIIALGANREEARRRLIDALQDTAAFGLSTNKTFLIDVLQQPAFSTGCATTSFINNTYGNDGFRQPAIRFKATAIAAALSFFASRDDAKKNAITLATPLLNWSSALLSPISYRYEHGDTSIELSLSPQDAHTLIISSKDNHETITLISMENNNATLVFGNTREHVIYHFPSANRAQIQLAFGDSDADLTNIFGVTANADDSAGAGTVLAPMHGLLIEVIVKTGQRVRKGDKLGIIEAMKMQHELIAAIDGEVLSINFEAGTQVEANSVIMDIAGSEAQS